MVELRTVAIIGGLVALAAAGGAVVMWAPPVRARAYLPDIAAAERAHGLPRNLLARVLYQESRFRGDIIRGEVTSSAGAVGIAQIVPRWHPDVDPTDPQASIHYAANYLRKLHDQFRRRAVQLGRDPWAVALMAYNWGPGNVERWLERDGLVAVPTETRDYVRQIMGDLKGVA